MIDLGLEIKYRPCTLIEEWEKQVPGAAFLREYKAKPLGSFNLRCYKGFDAVLSVVGWVP